MGPGWTTSAWAKSIEIPDASVIKWQSNTQGWRFGMGQSNAGLYFIRTNADDNSTGPIYDVFVANSGNVGIGSTNPDAKLTVKGGIHAEEVLIDMNITGPDYVFEDDYHLPSLAEIEVYIKANKHLPEVPSAKEMKENGVNVLQMNMLLLKKVEELTLHLIEMKKENDAVKERLRKLEGK